MENTTKIEKKFKKQKNKKNRKIKNRNKDKTT